MALPKDLIDSIRENHGAALARLRKQFVLLVMGAFLVGEAFGFFLCWVLL